MIRRCCVWCGCQLPWWMVWRWSWCPACAARASDAGIYLQSGGPPCREGAWTGRAWAERKLTDR